MRTKPLLVVGLLLAGSLALALAACPSFSPIPENYCTNWQECPGPDAGRGYPYCWDRKCGLAECGDSCTWTPISTPISLCDISAANCGFDCACNTGQCEKTTTFKVLGKEYPIGEGVFPSSYCSSGTSHVVGDAGGVAPPDAGAVSAPDAGDVPDGGAPDTGAPDLDAGTVDAGWCGDGVKLCGLDSDCCSGRCEGTPSRCCVPEGSRCETGVSAPCCGATKTCKGNLCQ